ncbi:MAG: flagellin FliC3 [Butyrivibrio sp.]|nr:flagellin FliC3 [Butyrivibrio sp.]
MKVNYNVSAMIANNALQRNDTLLSESLARLSSGLKIVNAKDNPSGLAMARRMNAQIEGLNVADNTSNDAISIVQVADGSLSELHEILQRMSELAIKASNGTLQSEDKKAIQSEINQLKDEIERMADTTQFNGQSILDGSFDLKGYATVGGKTDPDIRVVSYSDTMEDGKYTVSGINATYKEYVTESGVTRREINLTSPESIEVRQKGSTTSYLSEPIDTTVNEDVLTITDSTGKELKIELSKTFSGEIDLELTGIGAMTMQIGANEGQTIDIRIPEVSLKNLGLSNLDVAYSGIDSKGNPIDGAKEAIDSIKNAISMVSSIRSRLGAYQNRLEHTVSNLEVTVENMTAAYSRIMDVDMAEEMTTYSTQQVLSQAGTSMMAQANERPSQVLQLLQ